MDKQDETLKALANAWNEFSNIPNSEIHPDDTNDFRFHIHALQNIIFSQQLKKIKSKNTVTISGSDLVGAIYNTIDRNAK